MSLPIVASLWVGGPLSFIHQLCLTSFVDHGHRVVLYSYDSDPAGVPEGVELMDARLIYPRDDILLNSATGSPAPHAYAFRHRMLEVQNVVWVDLDMLCLKPFDFVDQWVFGWQVENRLVSGAVLGLPRFSKALTKLNGFCRKDKVALPWDDDASVVPIGDRELDIWGSRGLTHFLRETDEISNVMPESAFCPVSFKQRRDLLVPGQAVDETVSESFGVHLWNRRLSRWIVGALDGVVPADSFLSRALDRHGIDPLAAPIIEGAKPRKTAVSAVPKPQAAAPGGGKKADRPVVSPQIQPGRVPQSQLGTAPLERRAIDPALPTVASLWIGGGLSFLEQLCLISFRDFGHRTVLFTYGEVSGVPEGIEVMDANVLFPQTNFIRHKKSGSPAVHADAFRYRMIAKEHMIWIDADILCMQPWDFKDEWVFGWEKTGQLVCNAVLGLPSSSRTLERLNELCSTEYPIPPWAKPDERARLEKAHAKGNPVHVSELEWGVWGPAAVTYFLKETGEIEHAQPQKAFFPVSFKDRRDLLSPEVDLDDQLGEGCYGVHLWNRRIRRRIVTDENGLPPPDGFLGQALLRHRVDPCRSIIPDHPPPGFGSQAEQRAKLPPHTLAERVAEFHRRAARYGAITDKANPMVDGSADEIRWATGGTPEPVTDTSQTPVPTPAQAAAVAAKSKDAMHETPEQSNNPNVIVSPPAALKEMPMMGLQQSPEYQQAIDDLEGRTGGMTGYLKDPETPIKNDNILIVTSMKNESPFILEWIAYHKSIGADHFLVYTNDCTDNTNEILDRLDELGHVTRVSNPWDPASGKKPQHVALKDALKQPCYAEADWVLTIDVDEFVNIHCGEGTFKDLFRASNYPNVIAFTWKFFGNKNIQHYEDRPITEQFVNCAPEFIPKPRLGWGFKSMFHKTSPYTRIGVHRPLGIEDDEADQVRWVNGSGRAMPDMLLTNNGWRSTKRSLGYRLATLNHYILRSTESFLVKRERGRINHTEHDQGIDYWTRRNYATETDNRIHARLPRMQGVLDGLMADKVLGRLHKDAVKWHKGRIAALLDNPDYKQLFDDLITPDRPDALTIAKQAEAAEQSQDAAVKVTPRADNPGVALIAAAPLQALRMITPPDSASQEPVHERFSDARKFASQSRGFFWEGDENALMFAPRSKRLVVSFDNISIAREEGQRWPWGFKVLWQDMGCSVLGVMGVQRNWFRQEFVHDSFEALRDQGFFDQFDEILFYGASMGGFAALVYQQCAPGSNVLAIAPQSTLNRNVLPNEDRWGWTKKLDWEGRFNDAAGTLDTAGEVFILADPYYKPDYDQVSRLTGDNVTWLHTPFMGHQLPNAFVVMNIMKDLLYSAAGGTLTPQLFYKLFRARNDLPRFQHDLLMEAEKRGKIRSAIQICEYTLKKRKAGNIQRTLEKLQQQLAETERKEAAE